jgi:thiol-disulfide isomerase/thioredoxin
MIDSGVTTRRRRLQIRPTLLVQAVAVAALLLGAAPARLLASGNVPLAAGASAPPVVVPTASGTFDSTETRKPYVLEFFAVWCPHCQREVAALNRLQAADGSRVDIIAVPASPFSFDSSSPLLPSDLRTFVRQFNVKYRIGFDGLYALAYNYGVMSFPVFYVVDTRRTITAVEGGEISFEKLHADVAALFAKP